MRTVRLILIAALVIGFVVGGLYGDVLIFRRLMGVPDPAEFQHQLDERVDRAVDAALKRRGLDFALPDAPPPSPTPEFRAEPEVQPFYPDDPSDRRATPTPAPSGISI